MQPCSYWEVNLVGWLISWWYPSHDKTSKQEYIVNTNISVDVLYHCYYYPVHIQSLIWLMVNDKTSGWFTHPAFNNGYLIGKYYPGHIKTLIIFFFIPSEYCVSTAISIDRLYHLVSTTLFILRVKSGLILTLHSSISACWAAVLVLEGSAPWAAEIACVAMAAACLADCYIQTRINKEWKIIQLFFITLLKIEKMYNIIRKPHVLIQLLV